MPDTPAAPLTENTPRTTIVLLPNPAQPGAFTVSLVLSPMLPGADPEAGLLATDIAALALIEVIRDTPPEFTERLARVQERLDAQATAAMAAIETANEA